MIRKINVTLAVAVLALYIGSLVMEGISFMAAYPLLAVMFLLYGIESVRCGRKGIGAIYFSFSCFLLAFLTGSLLGWI
ncbi:hypothetical protein [Indiicoccus explosivorum]|uniref:hypothetical protein n=1 Tax=Indiicoccus explosivorum TaxID=1917864 RepID=UPI000B451BCE|nr:hypothetical protein [Indiicoccus explosivorum]